MPLFGKSLVAQTEYDDKRFVKIRTGLKVTGLPGADNVAFFYKLIKDNPLGTDLNASISFPGNWGWSTSERDRDITRVIIFLAHFKEALDNAPDLGVLKNTRTKNDQAHPPNSTTRLPPPGDTSAFTSYIIANKVHLAAWAGQLVQEFIGKDAAWKAKFDPQSIINRGQQVINEENTGKFIEVNSRITDLERRMLSVETKIDALEISHQEFKSRVERDLELITIQQRVLSSTLIQTKDRLDEEISLRKLQIESVNADVAVSRDKMVALGEEVKQIHVSVLADKEVGATERAKLAALAAKVEALQRDFLEQCGFLAEVAVATWLTMETVKLQWNVTSRVIAATEGVLLLRDGQREAKAEYNAMFETANQKEEVIINALKIVLMAAEIATPLPFNIIVKFIRTNAKYIIGIEHTPATPVPTAEIVDSDLDEESSNPVKRFFQGGLVREETPIIGSAGNIEVSGVKAFVETQVQKAEHAVSQKAEGAVRKYFTLPIFVVGWCIQEAPSFDKAIELAKNETILRLHQRMDLAIEGMLNRKKLKYAVQAAYLASGGNEVGGLKPAVVAERVFQKVRAGFDPVWTDWDNNLLTVLRSGRKEQIKEAFLVLFIAGFFEHHVGGRSIGTLDELPEGLVKWLRLKRIIVPSSHMSSAEVYEGNLIPWFEKLTGKSNANRALVVTVVFLQELSFQLKNSSVIQTLFRAGNGDSLLDSVRARIKRVGFLVNQLKQKDSLGRVRANRVDIDFYLELWDARR